MSLNNIKVMMGIVMLVTVIPPDTYSQGEQKCKRPSKQCQDFILSASGSGVDDGMPMHAGIWKSPGGAKIFQISVQYPSPAAAAEKLEVRLGGAAKVIERTPAMKNHQRVGERVVAVFPKDAGGEKVVIFRTSGEYLFEIVASSRRLALAFEEYSFP